MNVSQMDGSRVPEITRSKYQEEHADPGKVGPIVPGGQTTIGSGIIFFLLFNLCEVPRREAVSFPPSTAKRVSYPTER